MNQTDSTAPLKAVHLRRFVQLCVDCSHYKQNFTGEDTCRRKDRVTGINLVTGKDERYGNIYCDRETGFILSRLLNQCGKEGRFFKPNAKAQTPPAVTLSDLPGYEGHI